MKGTQVDHKDLYNLIFGGIANILSQSEALENVEKNIKGHQHH